MTPNPSELQTQQKERPILFKGAMVRAILAGTKTQTRRIVKPQPRHRPILAAAGITIGADAARDGAEWLDADCINPGVPMRCPYGQPGDRLWVKETFLAQACGFDDLTIRYVATADAYSAHGVADGSVPDSGLDIYYRMFDKSRRSHDKPVSHPSIFMPRWASRITLEITGVRVERLNDCSANDALAEGVSLTEFWKPKELNNRPFEEKWWDDYHFWTHYPQRVYRTLWESINGPGSWAANPWVWVVEFKRINL